MSCMQNHPPTTRIDRCFEQRGYSEHTARHALRAYGAPMMFSLELLTKSSLGCSMESTLRGHHLGAVVGVPGYWNAGTGRMPTYPFDHRRALGIGLR